MRGKVVLGVLAALVAAPSASADVGKLRTIKSDAADPGNITVFVTDVVATSGGDPGKIRVRVSAAASIRPRLRVSGVTTKLGGKKRLVIYAANTRDTTGGETARASIARRITVDLRGIKKPIRIKNTQKVQNGLPGLSGSARSMVCDGSNPDVTVGFLGFGNKSASELARTERRVLCGTPAPDDQRYLADRGIGALQGSLSCRAFGPSNFFEGVCRYTGSPFRQLRFRAGTNNSFNQCFAPATACAVENPGQAGNSIVFMFDADRTDSGDLNLRSGSQQYTEWLPIQVFTATDPGQDATFSSGPSFDPQ